MQDKVAWQALPRTVWRSAPKTREEARQNVFDCIEMFCIPVRKHVGNPNCHPAESISGIFCLPGIGRN